MNICEMATEKTNQIKLNGVAAGATVIHRVSQVYIELE